MHLKARRESSPVDRIVREVKGAFQAGVNYNIGELYWLTHLIYDVEILNTKQNQ